jgi:hypothetical protein
MIQPPRHFWELLKTYYAGESVSSGTRRTLGTCPLLTANFTRSRRFLEAPCSLGRRAFKTCLKGNFPHAAGLQVPKNKTLYSAGIFKHLGRFALNISVRWSTPSLAWR